MLAGNRYGRGKRYFASTVYAVVPELTVGSSNTHAIANDFAVAINQRLDLVVHYNVLKALQNHGAW